MPSCCPICYRATAEPRDIGCSRITKSVGTGGGERDVQEGVDEEEVKVERFFRLLERYLCKGEEVRDGGIGVKVKPLSDRDDDNPDMGSFTLDKLIGRGRGLLAGCGECLELMEGFCEKYHQLKTIELELNWKVERLRKVMKGAQRVPSRVNYFREVMGRVNVEGKCLRGRKVEDLVGSVIKEKKALIEKCSRKLRSTFPKLPVTKWQPGTEGGTSLKTGIGNTGHVPPQISAESGPSPVASLESQSDGMLGSKDNDHLQNHSQHDITEAGVKDTVAAGRKRNMAGTDSETDDVTVPKSKQIRYDDEVDKHSMGMDDDGPMDCDYNSEVTQEDSEALPVPKSPQKKIELSERYLKTEPHAGCLPADLECATTPEATLVDPPSMTVIALPETGSPEATSSRLRSAHRCSHCDRTFSSVERLQLHIQEDHNVDDDIREPSAGNEHEDLGGDDGGDSESEYSGGGGERDGDNMCWTSSSSEDEYEVKFQAKSPHNHLVEAINSVKHPFKSPATGSTCQKSETSTSKSEYVNNSSISTDKSLHNPLMYKCPDCNILFKGMKTLLLHRKTSSSCKHLYNASASIKVEVFNVFEDNQGSSDTDASKCMTRSAFAVVELPQEFYICQERKCGEANFYNSDDFEDHKKLHGTFQCKFCKVKKHYAPNLSLHEHLKHAPVVMNGTRDYRSRRIYNCPRCDFETGAGSTGPQKFIRHHLEHHLNLVFNKPECAICQDKLLLKSQLKSHLKTHHDLTNIAPEDVKRCPNNNCNAYFVTSSQLAVHQWHQSKCNRNESGFRLKCPDCSELFQSINNFLIHRKDSTSCGSLYDPATSVRVEVFIPPPSSQNDVHDGGDVTNGQLGRCKFSNRIAIIELPQAIFTCDICQTIVYSSEDLEAHKKLHGRFPCSDCDEELTFAPKLAMHELKHKRRQDKRKHSKLPTEIRCPRCVFKLHSLGRALKKTYVRHFLEQHLSLTLNEPTCSICNTNPDLSRPLDLWEHFKKYHDLTNATTPESVKRCTVTNCQAYFLSGLQLSNHLRMRHKLDFKAKKHKCKDCDQSFGVPHSLREHRLKCHADNLVTIPCVFENCPRVFESKEEIQRHITAPWTVHEPLDDPSKKVPCPKCEASFSGAEPNLLVQHLKSEHRWGKSYFCELCGKSFKDQARLNVHSLTHSGPDSWQFMCSVCSRKCMTKQKLEDHMRTHTGEKRFICEVCGDKFSQPVHLRVHVKSKHAGMQATAPRRYRKSNPIRSKLSSSPSGKKKSRKRKISEDEDVCSDDDDDNVSDT